MRAVRDLLKAGDVAGALTELDKMCPDVSALVLPTLTDKAPVDASGDQDE